MGRKQDADKAPNEPDTLAAEIDALPEGDEKALARKYLGHLRGGRNVPTDQHTLDCLIAEAKRKAEAG